MAEAETEAGIDLYLEIVMMAIEAEIETIKMDTVEGVEMIKIGAGSRAEGPVVALLTEGDLDHVAAAEIESTGRRENVLTMLRLKHTMDTLQILPSSLQGTAQRLGWSALMFSTTARCVPYWII
jgi:hypothetical protein